MIINKINHFVTWNNLRTLGENSLLRSSYYWFFLVPIAAKILSQVKSPLDIELFGQIHSLSLELPFSWILFYFSSTAFAIATLIYSIFCPDIIRKFPYFSSFYQLGNGVRALYNHIEGMNTEFINQNRKRDFEKVAWNSVGGDSKGFEEDKLPDWTVEEIFLRMEHRLKREEMGDLFYLTSFVHGFTKPALRSVVGGFYLIGFSFLFIVFIQNFFSVLKMVNWKW